MRPKFRLIDLPRRADARGSLTFGQDGDHVPFAVKRFFLIRDVPPGASRGGHAHRAQHQLLMMPAGAVTITVHDGRDQTMVRIDRPDLALYAPPMLWLDLTNVTAGAVCLVLASDVYEEMDYIRDRDEFFALTKEE